MKNRELVRDIIVDKVAAAEKIRAGDVTYLDGAAGRKKVDSTTAKESITDSVRVAEVEADNTGGAYGAISVTTYKTGAIICVKAHGILTLDCQVQTSTGGKVVEADELDSTTATTSTLTHHLQRPFGYYLGKPGQIDEVGVDRTNAAAEDEVFIVLY